MTQIKGKIECLESKACSKACWFMASFGVHWGNGLRVPNNKISSLKSLAPTKGQPSVAGLGVPPPLKYLMPALFHRQSSHRRPRATPTSSPASSPACRTSASATGVSCPSLAIRLPNQSSHIRHKEPVSDPNLSRVLGGSETTALQNVYLG